MAKVVIMRGTNRLAEVAVDKPGILIGRHVQSDIRLDDLAVSSKHAELVSVGGDMYVHDLGSTNGTYVNGMLTKRCAVIDGDIIGLGSHKLEFHTNRATDTIPDFEKTMVIRTDMLSAQSEMKKELTAIRNAEQKEQPVTARPTTSRAKQGRLEVTSGPMRGRQLALAKNLVSIGRPGIQVAVVSRRAQGYYLTHVAGASGNPVYPIVNRQSIGPVAHKLTDGDVIELAGVKMEFQLR